MKVIIANAFSLSMLDPESQQGTPTGYAPSSADLPGRVARTPRPLGDGAAEAAKKFLRSAEDYGVPVESAVGHADTAALFSELLDRDVPMNRQSVKLDPETILLVGQYTGTRLPEGATELPEGATVFWWRV